MIKRLASIAGTAAVLVAASTGTAEAAAAPKQAVPVHSAATTAVDSGATTAFASGEFQCGPNNWVGVLVPENPPGGANFYPACYSHDACYNYASWTDRATCDLRFRNDMYYACDIAGKGSLCKGVANTYYYAVRGAGWMFYDGQGANN